MLMCSYTHYWNSIIYVLISHTFYECRPTQLVFFFYHIIISCPAMKPSLAKVTLLGFYKGMKVNRWPMHVISIVTVYHWPMPTIYQHSYDRWCFLEWAHQNMTQTIYKTKNSSKLSNSQKVCGKLAMQKTTRVSSVIKFLLGKFFVFFS